jgi:hypothetical protein
MAPLAANRKRKQNVKEASPSSDTETFPAGGLDMLSGDEDEQENGSVQDSDIDEVDAFPEIDAASDTEEGEGESSSDDAKLSETAVEEEDDEDVSSDDDLHIFPKAKTVISDITGQPKKVYPEIEPDYDSDSSTEDVRAFLRYLFGYIDEQPSCSQFYRHLPASEIYHFIGMTICLTSDTILMVRKSSNRHAETNSISSCERWTTLPHGEYLPFLTLIFLTDSPPGLRRLTKTLKLINH